MLLFVLFAAIQANELEPLKILSSYYGFNDCMSLSSSDSRDFDVQRELGCPVTQESKGLFGLVDGEQSRAQSTSSTRLACGNLFGDMGTNLDAMPVSFNYPVIDGLEPEYFIVTLNDGTTSRPDCVIFAPAGEDDERRSPVILGHWGDGNKLTKWPVKVQVDGPLLFNVNGVVESGNGLMYDNEEEMKWDIPLTLNEAYLMDYHEDSGNNGCADQLDEDSEYHIKISLNGGGTVDGINEFEAGRKDVFELLDKDGNVMVEGYHGMAGLGDLDNLYDLCLDKEFNIDDVAYVQASCDEERGTVFVPPKGAYPCVPHRLKIDKSRLTDAWKNTCKCDFDVNYKSACDPNGLLNDDEWCDIPRDTACDDRKFRWGSMNSRDACRFSQNYKPQDEGESLAFATMFETNVELSPSDVAVYSFAAVGVLTILYHTFSHFQKSKDHQDVPSEDTPLQVEA